LAKGQDAVVKNAINGLNAMPAKGGNADLDDVEVARAVVFMANQSGGKFKEPEVKAAVPTAAATAPAQDAGAPAASATEPLASSSQQVKALGGGTASVDGKKIYDTACIACHGSGVAGAPKMGDKAAWAPRIAQGSETMYGHAIKGFQGKSGFMPPKGGSSASDAEIKAAVDYMASASK
jgi:cytochrome c5